MKPVTLFGLERSVYTRIVRLALAEKGVPATLHEVEIFGPQGVPPEHLQRHPFGRIPVLQHGDFMLYETAAITRYVDEAFPGPALQPSAVRERALMQQIIGLLDSYAYRPMVWGVFVERRRPAPDEAVIHEAREKARRALQALASLSSLDRGTPWLQGDTPTLADWHAWPMLQCLARVPDGQALLADFPLLAQWLARGRARPSAQQTRWPDETGTESP